MISEVSQARVGMMATSSTASTERVDSLQRVNTLTSTTANTPETAAGAEQQQAQSAVDSRRLEGVVQDLNEFAQVVQRKLQFNIDEESGKTIIRVVDAQTDEVIREVPPEAVVEMQKHLAQVNGVLFHSKA